MWFQYDQSDSKELNAVDKTKFDDVGEDDDDEGFEDDDEEGEDDAHRWNFINEFSDFVLLTFHIVSGYGNVDDVPDDEQYDYGNEEYQDTTPTAKAEEENDDNNIYKDMKRARWLFRFNIKYRSKNTF